MSQKISQYYCSRLVFFILYLALSLFGGLIIVSRDTVAGVSANGATSIIYYLDEIEDGTFLKNWLIAGPFPNCDSCRAESFHHDERCAGFFRDYLAATGGEADCIPDSGDIILVPDLNDQWTWQIVVSTSKTINLQDIYPQSEQIVVYAFCQLYSPVYREIGLALGSNDGVQVFLNGKRIHLAHPSDGRGIRRDDDFIILKLSKGYNRLLLKIENGYGEFGFVARLVDPDSPLADLIRTKGQAIELSLGDLAAIFIDNYAFGENHRAGYNGIAELRHVSLDSNLFLPNYAGFNLEHIFSTDSLVQLFEPRRNPMSVKKISETEVLLHQPETPISQVESWTIFKMVAPHYIDIHFRCVIHSTDFFQNNPAGLFWASYINAPADKKIYFWGRKKAKSAYEWIAAYSPAHGVASTHMAENDKNVLASAPGFNVVLASHYSDFLFRENFYFGRFHDMVFAYLFDTQEDQVIRFSQSPTGGGETNPAWDFQFIIPAYEVGREYSFSCRLIYKKFIDAEDIRQEFKNWRQDVYCGSSGAGEK